MKMLKSKNKKPQVGVHVVTKPDEELEFYVEVCEYFINEFTTSDCVTFCDTDHVQVLS